MTFIEGFNTPWYMCTMPGFIQSSHILPWSFIRTQGILVNGAGMGATLAGLQARARGRACTLHCWFVTVHWRGRRLVTHAHKHM